MYFFFPKEITEQNILPDNVLADFYSEPSKYFYSSFKDPEITKSREKPCCPCQHRIVCSLTITAFEEQPYPDSEQSIH